MDALSHGRKGYNGRLISMVSGKVKKDQCMDARIYNTTDICCMVMTHFVTSYTFCSVDEIIDRLYAVTK